MKSDILRQSIDHGFDDAYLVPPLKRDDIPHRGLTYDITEIMPDAQSVLLLLKRHHPYKSFPKASMRVHSHYPAYQKAYSLHKSLIEKLHNMGFNAQSANRLPLKQYAVSAGFFRLKNSLLCHHAFGSYFVLQAIVINIEAEPISSNEDTNLCGNCVKCIAACPTGAIDFNNRIDINTCIRHHVPVGNYISNKFRAVAGRSYIGCDICQSVCPLNNDVSKVAPSAEIIDVLDIEGMLDISANKLQLSGLAQIIGKNEVRPARAIATACLAAGNTKDEKYLPYLKTILSNYIHPLPRGYAAWAIGNIGGHISFLENALLNERNKTVKNEILSVIKDK